MIVAPGTRISFHRDPPHVRMTINDKPVTVESVKQRLYQIGTKVILVQKFDEVINVKVSVAWTSEQ